MVVGRASTCLVKNMDKFEILVYGRFNLLRELQNVKLWLNYDFDKSH